MATSNSTLVEQEENADVLLFSVTAAAFLVLPLSIQAYRMLRDQFPKWSVFQKDDQRK